MAQEWEDFLEEDEEFAEEFQQLCDNEGVPEADDNFDPNSCNHHLKMESAVDTAGHKVPQFAKVTKRLKDHCGNPMGTAHSNPILDTRMCKVKFAHGSKQVMAANVIAENMFASVDKEGHQHLLLNSTVNH